jgi:hypothetical protein
MCGVIRFRSMSRSFLGRDRDALSEMECKAIAAHPFAVAVEEQLEVLAAKASSCSARACSNWNPPHAPKAT